MLEMPVLVEVGEDARMLEVTRIGSDARNSNIVDGLAYSKFCLHYVPTYFICTFGSFQMVLQ